jgi:hypothetical protein
MSINSNFKGVSRLAMILAAGLSVACGQVQVQGTDETVSEPDPAGYGTFALTSKQFPEGAESLALVIEKIGGGDDPCREVHPLPPKVFNKGVNSGLGLQTQVEPDWRKCVPVLYKHDVAKADAEHGSTESVRVIHIKRGGEIKPIRLRNGSYSVRADFLDASNQLIYTGSAVFQIRDGARTEINIRLKKIESGEVTIGFDVEKPEVLPRKISGDVRLELSLNLMEKYEKKMDLDLVKGTAVISARCIDDRKCKVAVNEKKVTLSRQSLMTINAIISAVQIKHTQKDTCVQPQEYITLLLKSCAECDSRKTHKFINFCFSPPYHTLTGVEFEKIWSTVNGAVSGSPQVAASK